MLPTQVYINNVQKQLKYPVCQNYNRSRNNKRRILKDISFGTEFKHLAAESTYYQQIRSTEN